MQRIKLISHIISLAIITCRNINFRNKTEENKSIKVYPQVQLTLVIRVEDAVQHESCWIRELVGDCLNIIDN